MSDVVKLRTRAEIEEEAAAWIWRMEAGGADAEAYEAWLRQDPRHRRAAEELGKVWQALDGLTVETVALEPRQRGWGRYVALAAAVLVAAAGVAAWLYKGDETQTLATAVGQHRSVSLSDGSVIALNTNTIVETNFSRRSRDIYLRKGEAHFEVAGDRSRPFQVHAGDAVVRAIGTEFEVRVRPDQHVDVLVNQGRVEVHPVGPVSSVAAAAVSAGEQLSTATTNYAVITVTAEQVSSELAWKDGAVVFDSEPLSQAIAEIQRYTDARIVISDPRIGTLPVGGRFKTDDLQGFLDGLEAALPVMIRRTPDGQVYIDPR